MTVCAHLNCARHRWLLPVNSDIWRIFCPVFVQAMLERIHCSAGCNFIWYGIPGWCYFNWVKVLGNWWIDMFYNKFCSIVSCSVIKVIIEEPSCTGSSELIQVFKTLQLVVLAVFFLQIWWDQVPGFAGGSCGFWFQESSLLLFSVSSPFYKCLALNVGTKIELHVRDVGGLGICIMVGSVLCFCT